METETKTNTPNQKKKGLIIALCVIIVLAVVVCYNQFSPQTVEGQKSITVNVEHTDGTTATFDVTTTEEYLYAAVEDLEILEGEDSDWGLFVVTVDGEYADSSEGAYWMYNCNGEYALYGVESQPIEDGDVYDFFIEVYSY